MASQEEAKMISAEEVAKHNKQSDLWLIVNDWVYDLTDFQSDHPGGAAVLRRYAGMDATEAYTPLHPPGTIENTLAKEKHLGRVDPKTVKKVVKEVTVEEQERLDRVKVMPKIDECLNLFDFESVAKKVMKNEAFAYYSSGADDEITMRENHSAFHRIWFRPRILRNVETINFETTILGCKSSLPIYVTATALGKLGHPDGEVCLTRAAAREGIPQMIPTLASCAFEEMIDAREDGGPTQFMQLYVNKDRDKTFEIISKAEKAGCKGLFITVDAPQLGRREKDMRMKYVDDKSNAQDEKDVDRSQGAARAISSFIDPSLCWDDLRWFKTVTKMPLILKGVGCAEDAILAVEAGMAGIVISNHGGRQLEFARSGIEVLVEVVNALKEHGYEKKLEIFIDGGIRRATDILKAIALGAKAVGIGRPFLYAMSAYGVDGVVRAIQLLKDEMQMDMRLLGTPTLADVVPEMIDARNIGQHSVSVPFDTLGTSTYMQMTFAGTKPKL